MQRNTSTTSHIEYNDRAAGNANRGKRALAIVDFIQALTLAPNYETALHNLKLTLLLIEIDDLIQLTKPDLLSAIKKLAIEDQIPFLKQCLDKKTSLGMRMWANEFPWTGCSLEKGTLKQICDHLKSIDPNFIIPTITTSVTTNTIFGMVDPEKYLETQNKVTSDFYYNKL